MQVVRRGALRPLLFFLRMGLTLALAAGLSACGSSSAPPRFLATGYVADQGIMRIWRKDSGSGQPLALMSVYTPLRDNGTVVSQYEYTHGKLTQVQQSHGGGGQESLLLRFDENDEISFMQRQLSDRKEALSADDVTRARFQARRALEMSDTLRAGQVRLQQGRWSKGQYTSCAGTPQKLKLDAWQTAWIEQRAARTALPLGIAWLDAPEGTQLLLVANENFCSWEPTEKSM